MFGVFLPLAAEKVLGALALVPFVVGTVIAPSSAGHQVLVFRDPQIVEASALVVRDGLFETTNDSGDVGRVFTVEENPRLCGWGAEVASIIHEEIFDALKAPVVRITTPHIPLPAADRLEDAVVPTPQRIAEEVKRSLETRGKRA